VKIGVVKENKSGETRVALVPADIRRLIKQNHNVFVESGAGELSFFPDEEYKDIGAKILKTSTEIFSTCNLIVKVEPPDKRRDLPRIKDSVLCISFLSPFKHLDLIKSLKKKQITAFAMELIPRITRAQSMDALSSMATLAGYKSVLQAADMLTKIFPMMMTAAGTIPPATVLVLGAGVAGLSAIATAKRLGAKVEAFDPRPVVKEQVKSLGAQFIEMELSEEAETAGGYAKMQSDAFLKHEQETIAARLSNTDIVITTAQIFGKPSPLLITKEMVTSMKPGSIIMDLAAEQGGNCAHTIPGKVITINGVHIVGALNLPALLPTHASMMYSKNISTLIQHIFSTDKIDFSDEIINSTCVTHQGEIINPMVKTLMEKEKKK